MKTYPHLLGLIFNRPQLASPELMYSALAFARHHLGVAIAAQSGQTLTARMDAGELLENLTGQNDDETGFNDDGSGITVIGVYGPLVPRTGNLAMCQTMTAYETVAGQLDQALTDPTIAHIVLDIDTPGGSATGAFELADKIRAACAVKPVSAIVNFNAFSGGYLIAAACSEISVSQSSGVGSIGVIAQHMDVSKQMADEGVVVTAIYRGAQKNDLTPFAPLTDSSLAFLNGMVDRVYAQFTGAVAAYRNLSVNQITATEAGVYFGQDAITAGLADRLETPQDAINRIAGEVAAQRAPAIQPVQNVVTPQRMRLAATAMEIQATL